MAPLDAVSRAWTQADASKPLDWQISGIYGFGDEWIALAEGPESDDYLSGSGSTPPRRCSGEPTGCGSGGE